MNSGLTFKTTFLALTFAFCSNSAKSSISPKEQTAYETANIIRNYFSNNALAASGQKVEVLFTTGEKGMVNFVLAKTDDGTLKSEIEKQFLQMTFPFLSSNAVNSVTLHFKSK